MIRRTNNGYNISLAFSYWPGFYFELGINHVKTRDNPIGRRVERWLDERAE